MPGAEVDYERKAGETVISGPYQVDELCLERHELEADDVGRWYILINGSMQFCKSREAARELMDTLKEPAWPKSVKDWSYYANLD